MRYPSVQKARFLSRPNRFVAYVEWNGTELLCHVKNTGRCKELLLPGATVYLCESRNPARKTRFDLIAVEKNGVLFKRRIRRRKNGFGTAAWAFFPLWCGLNRNSALPVWTFIMRLLEERDFLK